MYVIINFSFFSLKFYNILTLFVFSKLDFKLMCFFILKFSKFYLHIRFKQFIIFINCNSNISKLYYELIDKINSIIISLFSIKKLTSIYSFIKKLDIVIYLLSIYY